MITSYTLTLSSAEKSLSAENAYRLYSWLLSQLPADAAEQLHAQESHPISQYLAGDSGQGKTCWHINILNEDACRLFSPILDDAREISLHAGRVMVTDRQKISGISAQDLVKRGMDSRPARADIRFLTPTSFKQNGRYVMFPQESLIVRSLIRRWNCFFPELPMDDEDALLMLEQGIRITDYSLRSRGYTMKATRIPGFVGRLGLCTSLPVPLMQLWGTLLQWAPYSGLGIKTALGMGGICITQSE